MLYIKIKKVSIVRYVFSTVFVLTMFLDVAVAVSGEGFPGKDVTFYGEPILGLGQLSMDSSVALATNSTERSDSGIMPYFGAHLGWQVDYVHVLFHGKYGRNFGDVFGDSNYREFGVGVGWEWNIPLITTVIYKFSGKTNVEGRDISGGSGFELQLGYFVSEDLKASFVYSAVSFDLDSVGTTTNSVDADFIGLSLSFPMAIPYPSEWWRKNL